jgi:hypothetical protein
MSYAVLLEETSSNLIQSPFHPLHRDQARCSLSKYVYVRIQLPSTAETWFQRKLSDEWSNCKGLPTFRQTPFNAVKDDTVEDLFASVAENGRIRPH